MKAKEKSQENKTGDIPCGSRLADYVYHYLSPLGGITLSSNGTELTGLWFDGQKYFGDKPVRRASVSKVIREA